MEKERKKQTEYNERVKRLRHKIIKHTLEQK